MNAQDMKVANEQRQLAFDGFDHPYFGTGVKIIDFDTINQDEFACKVKNGLVLINPRPTKHRWLPEEYHLRSLLCDQRGRVLSSGLPKFLNYTENAEQDRLLHEHVAAGTIEVAPKLDGSLIIMDLINGQHLHFRTRGSHDLNEFAEPVVGLIKQRYPQLLAVVTEPANRAFFAQHSVLFEYTAPTNQIVLHYPEPALTLLAYVDKGSLRPRWDAFTLTRLSKAFGCGWAKPEAYVVDDAGSFRRFVAEQRGIEGYVLRSTVGEPFLIKVKTEEYCLIHSVKFGFNERKVAKLAFLLNLRPEQDLLEVLGHWGLDAECVEILRPWFAQYFARLADADSWYDDFIDAVEVARRVSADSRKEFVFQIKGVIADHGYPEAFFPIAMKAYDCRWDDARMLLLAYVLGESVGTVRHWVESRDAELADLFKGGMDDAE